MGADEAVLLRARWRDTRRAVLAAGGVTEFTFRQYLHATQARVLLRMGRHQEVRLYAKRSNSITQSEQFAYAKGFCIVLVYLICNSFRECIELIEVTGLLTKGGGHPRSWSGLKPYLSTRAISSRRASLAGGAHHFDDRCCITFQGTGHVRNG